MKSLTFITGNSEKLAELQAFLPFVQGKKLELPEIQSVDINDIVQAKLDAAVQVCDGPVIVDDTALYLECFAKNGQNGELPGPLIKWFLKTVGNARLAEIAGQLGKTGARAQTVIGYAENKNKFHFFEGTTSGKVIAPQGTSGFGWDHIFVPNGYAQTFAKMGQSEKNKISPRAQAVQKLKQFLNG